MVLTRTDNTLNIKIVSTDGSEVFFKIKKTTKLNKLKVSFAIWRPPRRGLGMESGGAGGDECRG
jgi:hypothetical protein